MTLQTRFERRIATITTILALAMPAGLAVAGGPIVIHGLVVDVEESPLDGATVVVVDPDGQQVGTAVTKKKGKFSIKVPDWERRYVIRASADGYVATEATFQPDPRQQGTVMMILATPGQPTPVPAPAPTAEGDERQTTDPRIVAIPVFNEGVDAIKAGDHATALAKFQQAAAIDPSFEEAYRGIAASALEVEDYATAADAAEKILEIDPDNVEAMGTAYYAELMGQDTERMVVAANRLVEANPEIATNEMMQHARVLFEQNATAQSRALLEVIVVHNPEFAPGQFQLGLACNMLGDSECAQNALETFLELDPDSPEAETARGLLEYLD